MLGRRPGRESALENTAADDVLALAVYYRSDHVEDQLGELRAAGGVRLEFIRKGTLWTIPHDIGGVLWELTPDDGAQRLVAALIAHRPAVSFSTTLQPGLIELSRALGFREHLLLPLRVDDVERALGLRDLRDLADRIDVSTARVVAEASRPESIAAVLRAVSLGTNPGGVARALAAQADIWLPLDGWFVFAIEADGVPHLVTETEADPALRAALRSFADVVAHTGHPAVRVTNYLDDRMDAGTRPGRLDAGTRPGRVDAGTRAGGGDSGTRPAMVEVSLVGWPLVANGSTIGVLVGADGSHARRVPTISHACADALSRLLEPAAYALATALRVSRAEALSVTDDLTQLYNSRYLNDALRKETKRALRGGRPLSLLFIDLDGFKRINDAHGHLLGSRALIEAADVIRAAARETDIAARFGGDEFAILLPDTGQDGAEALARRLRERIQRFNFLAGSTAGGGRLSASIGVATLPDVADTAEGLLQAADAAMYRVKTTGKDGIHIATRDLDPGRGTPQTEEHR